MTICHENALLKQQHAYTEEQQMYAVLPVGPTRFDRIIEGLKAGESFNQVKVACLQLVNVLVCTPDELDFRMHLRNEFMRAGLIHILEVSLCASCASLVIPFACFALCYNCFMVQQLQQLSFLVQHMNAV